MMVLLLLLTTLGSLAVALTGVAGLLGKLPPNPFMGIRTPFTRRSEENWYRTHRAAAAPFIWGGIAGTMTGLAFLPFAAAGELSDGLVIGLVIAIGVIVVATVLGGWQYGVNQAKRPASEL